MGALGIVMPVDFYMSHQIPDPHCTLIYLGEYGAANIRQDDVQECADRLNHAMRGPTPVTVKGVEVFGNGRCTVLRLDDFVLNSYRKFIEKELGRFGIRSASQYSYNPHVTINKHMVSSLPIMPWDNFIMPQEVLVNRPTVLWNIGKVQ